MAAAAASPARASWRPTIPTTAAYAAGSRFRVGVKRFAGLQLQLQATSTRLSRLTTAHVKSGEAAEGRPSSTEPSAASADEGSLRRDLEAAIEEEDYARAARLRDELRALQDDGRSAVLAANARFYAAFRDGDLVAMRQAWAKGDHVYVVHPSAGRISGYETVMQSWEMVCDAGYEFPLQIDLQNVEVHVRGDVGYVTCLELVRTKGSGSWGKQVATNVFKKVDGKWFICIHHASHFDE
ncbi:hypothetical protein ACP70R_026080 [Stipagrostis hirtigluma subsp. patula]